MLLYFFFQGHVSALAMSHLQVYHFFLCKADLTISNAVLLLSMRSRVPYIKLK